MSGGPAEAEAGGAMPGVEVEVNKRFYDDSSCANKRFQDDHALLQGGCLDKGTERSRTMRGRKLHVGEAIYLMQDSN